MEVPVDIGLAVGLAVAVAIAFVMWRSRMPSADLTEIQAALDDGAQLIDVRSPAEFANGHLPGARNIPVDMIGQQAVTLAKQGKTIVVYCASGMRSAGAARILRGKGATVFDLGGMRNGMELKARG